MAHCTHSAAWRPHWDETTRHEALHFFADGRFAALPSVPPVPSVHNGSRNSSTSVGLCLLPKAASSRIKRYVFAALDRRGVAVGANWNECPHRQRLPPVLTAPTTAYLVVRHPLMRLASAWREIARRGFWHRLPHAARRPNATFALALRAIIATPPMVLNLHLRPLMHMCGLLGGRRYTLLYYEDWNTTVRTLQAHFAPDQPRLEYRASHTLAHAHHLYSRDLARAANAWAEADLGLGQYAPWQPGEAVRWGAAARQQAQLRLVSRA